MRDPDRIDEVLGAVRDLWTNQPDLRLGQILCNAARVNTGGDTDPFNLEDDDLVPILRAVHSTGQWQV